MPGPNKLGWQTQNLTGEAWESIRRAPGSHWKVIHTAINRDRMREYKDLTGGGEIVARMVFPTGESIDPAHRWAALRRHFDPVMDLVDSIETTYNEELQSGADLLRHNDYALWQVAQIHGLGKRAIVGNFSVSNPPVDPLTVEGLVEAYRPFVPAIKAGDDLGLHEYGWGQMIYPHAYWTFRYRAVRTALQRLGVQDPSICLTEYGYDHGIVDGRIWGYRGREGFPETKYADDLLGAAERLAEDGYVRWASLFINGAYGDFATFELAGARSVERVVNTQIRGVREGHQQLSFGRRVGPGLQKAAPVLGLPLEDEVYHFPGTPREVSLAIFERGYATWNPRTNETVAYVTEGLEAGDIHADFGNWRDGRLVLVRGVV